MNFLFSLDILKTEFSALSKHIKDIYVDYLVEFVSAS